MGHSIEAIRTKVEGRQRVTREEAAWLFEFATDADLQELASAVRGRFHPPKQATYLKMAIVNYTNVCVARCDYCAFYRFPDQPDTPTCSVSSRSVRRSIVPVNWAERWSDSTAVSIQTSGSSTTPISSPRSGTGTRT